MKPIMVTIQGRRFSPDIAVIRELLMENPGWGRTRLSVELCEKWDWRNPKGWLRDMACRSLLLRFERLGYIVLPPRRRKSTNDYRNRTPIWVPHRSEPVEDRLGALLPLQVSCPSPGSEQDRLFRYLLCNHHYLGYRNTVGENMKYLVHSRDGRVLACLLFGSAAWKSAARDAYIGWPAPVRERNLCYLANNSRFLVLPWVKVMHLASHLLSRIARRISADWTDKYGHSLWCLETFVDCSRYPGTCYRAANWRLVGRSRGRGRNDRHHRLEVPRKDIYLQPLTGDFQRRLRHDA